jgi:hypothetical protein
MKSESSWEVDIHRNGTNQFDLNSRLWPYSEPHESMDELVNLDSLGFWFTWQLQCNYSITTNRVLWDFKWWEKVCADPSSGSSWTSIGTIKTWSLSWRFGQIMMTNSFLVNGGYLDYVNEKRMLGRFQLFWKWASLFYEDLERLHNHPSIFLKRRYAAYQRFTPTGRVNKALLAWLTHFFRGSPEGWQGTQRTCRFWEQFSGFCELAPQHFFVPLSSAFLSHTNHKAPFAPPLFKKEVKHIRWSKGSYPRRYLTQWCALVVMNDCIRQTISSSPTFLSKIFVAPTTSAPALVLRTSTRVCTFWIFRIFVKQPAVIRPVTFKGLRASAIAAQLKLADKTEALALSIIRNGANALRKGELR